MTPCEKLGYKVGDKFEMLVNAYGWEVGEVVKLVRDDGSRCPEFEGVTIQNRRYDDNCMFLYVEGDEVHVKPLTAKLRPAKQALADAIHASGKGWPDGANWACQHKRMKRVVFTKSSVKPHVLIEHGRWKVDGDCFFKGFTHDKLLPNWHQTVLSRDEYFGAHPEKVAPSPETFNCKCVVKPLSADTDSLLATWQSAQSATREARAALEAAEQAEREAEEAVKAALGKYGWGESVVEGVPLEQPVVNDWRDLQIGDEIECTEYDAEHRFGVVCRIDSSSEAQPIMIDHGEGRGVSWPLAWKFIRRP